MTHRQKHGPCDLCGRVTRLTFHHLIPKKNHRKPWFRRNFSKEEMRTRGINVCRPCHSAIHRFYSEMQLGKELNTLAALRAQEDIQRHVEWICKRRVRS